MLKRSLPKHARFLTAQLTTTRHREEDTVYTTARLTSFSVHRLKDVPQAYTDTRRSYGLDDTLTDYYRARRHFIDNIAIIPLQYHKSLHTTVGAVYVKRNVRWDDDYKALLHMGTHFITLNVRHASVDPHFRELELHDINLSRFEFIGQMPKPYIDQLIGCDWTLTAKRTTHHDALDGVYDQLHRDIPDYDVHYSRGPKLHITPLANEDGEVPDMRFTVTPLDYQSEPVDLGDLPEPFATYVGLDPDTRAHLERIWGLDADYTSDRFWSRISDLQLPAHACAVNNLLRLNDNTDKRYPLDFASTIPQAYPNPSAATQIREALNKPLYPHKVNDTRLIGFYRNFDDFWDNRVSVAKPGKILGAYLDDQQTKYAVSQIIQTIAPVDVRFIRDSAELSSEYQRGPSSCMSKRSSEYRYWRRYPHMTAQSAELHPTRVYGDDSDIVMAAAYIEGNPVVRTLVNETTRTYVRIYCKEGMDATRKNFETYLKAQGYSPHDYAIIGARLNYHELENDGDGSYAFVLPYIDHGNRAALLCPETGFLACWGGDIHEFYRRASYATLEEFERLVAAGHTFKSVTTSHDHGALALSDLRHISNCDFVICPLTGRVGFERDMVNYMNENGEVLRVNSAAMEQHGALMSHDIGYWDDLADAIVELHWIHPDAQARFPCYSLRDNTHFSAYCHTVIANADVDTLLARYPDYVLCENHVITNKTFAYRYKDRYYHRHDLRIYQRPDDSQYVVVDTPVEPSQYRIDQIEESNKVGHSDEQAA